MPKLETHLLISIGPGDAEHEFRGLIVEYTHRRGYRQTLTDPGEPEHVEIGRVFVKVGDAVNPLPEWMIEPLTEQLDVLCLANWRDGDDFAREMAAEMRRCEMDYDRERQAEARRDDDRAARTWSNPWAAE